jgi:hypothetical protein
MIDLCRSVIGAIERQIRVVPLQVRWMPVTVQARDEGLAQLEAGTIDAFAGDRVRLVALGRLLD